MTDGVGTDAETPIPGGLLTLAAVIVLGIPTFALGWPYMSLQLSWRLAPELLGALVAAGLVAWTAWHWRRPRSVDDLMASRTPWLLAALAVPAGLRLASLVEPQNAGARLVGMLIFAVAVGVIGTLPDIKRLGWLTTPRIAVLVIAYVLVIAVHKFGGYLDVWVFLTNGSRALLHGTNPYGITFPLIYPPWLAHLFYGHGVIVGNRVGYGFPYPPVSLLWALPAYLLGDIRYAGVLALSVLAWTLSGPTTSRRTRAYALLFVAGPGVVDVLLYSWTESSIVALLGITIWAIKTDRLDAAAVLLGLLFVSKQYMVVTVPCLWLLRPLVTRRRMLLTVGTAGVVTLPFLLASPHAFWRSVVEWQFVQPFRGDSLSVLVYTVNRWGWPPEVVYGVLPIAAGLTVATLFSLRINPGPAQFATGIGLALLVMILLSKQAFINYYFLAGGAFLIAAWASEASSPGPRPTPKHQESSLIAKALAVQSGLPVRRT